MNNHILVCPFEDQLISGLHNHALVISLDNPRDVVSAAETVRRQNTLHAIKLKVSMPLSFIPFEACWEQIPLAVYAPELGDFKTVADMLHILRNLNIRLFLPAENDESFTAVRILSSLKIPAGLSFNGSAPDWDAMSDLMHYAAYSRVEHAPIEPFDYLIRNYEINGLTDFAPVYFKDPSRYLHINREGKAALSGSDLTKGAFISDSLEGLKDLDMTPVYRDRNKARQEHFLKPDGCAYCKGWRVCLGKFSAITEDRATCGNFFADVMEAAEHHKKIQRRGIRLWQP